MMVLHSSESRTAVMQKAATLRRRRSKGTIVAYGNENKSVESSDLKESQNSSVSVSSQPQHNATESSSSEPAKPCHVARLSLMSAQNLLKMGARAQLLLCPPGRLRRELQTDLRQKSRTITPSKRVSTESSGGYYGLDKLIGRESLKDYEILEEESLLNSNTFDESDEEASSGDEDEMCDFNEMFSEESPPLDDQDRYLHLREPLFVSAGAEHGMANAGGPMSMGPNAPGKLPFNRRKVRLFDMMTAADVTKARAYVRKELRRAKMRDALILSRHLRKAQMEERRRRRLEKGEPVDDLPDVDYVTPEEKALLNGGVEPLKPMTPGLAAALLLESLAVNKTESLEGMSKCYDGIVAAGVALLDSQPVDPTSLSHHERARPLRSQVMAALAPLLITSLEQPSGEVILTLAKIRRMCGTVRYQRRFVQRIAANLIRPPSGAMWCLKHQNDMEAIMVATELIFDAAFDIFGKGWYERGRSLLADTKRAKTLDAAAKKLKSLSSAEPSDGLALGFPGNRRRHLAASKRVGEAAGESLAEWEVIAVDRQIRVSIGNVFSMDWSRIAFHSDIPRPHNRRATVTSAKRYSTLPQAASSEMSPKSMASSPRSPSKSMYKTPQSPPHMPMSSSAQHPESMDHVFGPSYPVGSAADRPSSPPPPGLPSPPAVQRSNSKEMDSKTPMTPPRSPKSPQRPPTHVDALRLSDAPPPANLAPLSPKRNKFTGKETLGITPVQVMTPLSPSASSVGTTGSGEIISYKPSSASLSTTGSTMAAHHRMLTSTAAERKRTVAACRALRAQIQRFEDAFIALHGRAPKGAAERAPLATTYAQYREWKRAIRADAACRIQALFRGANTRWKLLRLNNPALTRVVMKKAGRSKGVENIVDQISIPVEIGQSDHDRSASIPLAPSSSTASSLSGHGQALAPQWASKIARRKSSDQNSLPTASSGSHYTSPSSPQQSTLSSDANKVSLAELQNRKRDLKQQLKQYDMNFARRHGRMPVKAEKEPIRHLYESYNALKNQISMLEQEHRHPPSQQSPVQSPVASNPLPQRVSPTSGSDSGHSGGEDSPARMASNPPPSARGKRKLPKAASPPIVTAPVSQPTVPTQDLASLKAEKTQLHQMLRSYERDFFREHRRQVSSFADIRPVANQYRRYKEIKKAIAALQQQEQG